MWPFFQPMSRVFPLTFDIAGGSAPNGRYLEGIEGGSGTFLNNHMQTLSFANSSSAHSSLRANHKRCNRVECLGMYCHWPKFAGSV